jgi:hypothetical protein
LGQLGGQLGQLGAIGAAAAPLGPEAPRAVQLGYAIKEKGGTRILVLKMRNQNDFEVPYKLKGDLLTLDGGVFEVGAKDGRSALLQAELKGVWARVDTVLEKKMLDAFPPFPAELDGFQIKLELRSERLLIAADRATVEPDGRIRLESCAVARLGSTQSKARPTTVRSEHALLTLQTPARLITDLKTGTLRRVEFADGLRLDLQ